MIVFGKYYYFNNNCLNGWCFLIIWESSFFFNRVKSCLLNSILLLKNKKLIRFLVLPCSKSR